MNAKLSKQEMNLCKEAAAGCLYGYTRQTSRALGQMYEGALRTAGLRGGQLPIFVALALFDSTTISQLGASLVMDRTTLTRNLKPLERDGQISIHPGEDRRTRMVSLTLKGYRTLSRALPLWKKNHDWVVKKLGKTKAKAFLGQMASTLEIIRKA